MIMMNLEEICVFVLEGALKAGAADVSVLASDYREDMTRFSNNTVTVVKRISNVTVDTYVSKDRKRIVGSSSDPSYGGLEKFTNALVEACGSLQPSPDYMPLPEGPYQYVSHENYDVRIAEDDLLLIDTVKKVVETGLHAGASRLSGSLTSNSVRSHLLTTGKAEGSDKKTGIVLNVRAFADAGGSGHGLSCACQLAGFNPLDASRTAAEYAVRSSNPRAWEEGSYDVILTPTVAANIVQNVGAASSAFAVEAGISFLSGQLGEKTAVESFTLRDLGCATDGLGSRSFDDEGVPTKENLIFERGVVKQYLHNTTTAAKFQKVSTGNAGIIDPHPWNLVVDEGDYGWEEMLQDVKHGVIVTNNWYTRFQNLRAGEYSTLPRDAAFLIQDGKIVHPVAGLRLSDSIPRQLKNIAGLTKERKWIQWWEVEIPVQTPAILIRDVTVTKPKP